MDQKLGTNIAFTIVMLQGVNDSKDRMITVATVCIRFEYSVSLCIYYI